MSERVVIVGTGQAGLQVAVSLRQGGYAGGITMIGRETHLPYQRPPLSKQLLKREWPPEKCHLRHAPFFVEDGIDFRPGTTAAGLVRAADLIGQMADPDYLRKLAALFYEFEETGANREVGCDSPEDLRRNYPDFFWKTVNRHIQPAIGYLEATREGRQWVASLYSHVFSEQHRAAL